MSKIISYIENIDSYESKTANYTAIKRDFIFADTSGGAFTITLPATPEVGDLVTIHDATGDFDTNNLTVARNGETIMGLAEDMTIKTTNATAKLMYSGADWRLL